MKSVFHTAQPKQSNSHFLRDLVLLTQITLFAAASWESALNLSPWHIHPGRYNSSPAQNQRSATINSSQVIATTVSIHAAFLSKIIAQNTHSNATVHIPTQSKKAEIEWLISQGEHELEQGNTKAAINYFLQASTKDAQNSDQNDLDFIRIHRGLVLSFLANHQLDAALRHATIMSDRETTLIHHWLNLGSQSERLSHYQRASRSFEELFAAFLPHADIPTVRHFLLNFTFQRKDLLLNASTRDYTTLKKLDPETRQLLEKRNILRNKLASLGVAISSAQAGLDAQMEHDQLKRTLREIEGIINSKHAKYPRGNPWTLSQRLQQSLSGTGLVELVQFGSQPQRYGCFWLTADQPLQFFVLDQPAEDIDRKLTSLRNHILNQSHRQRIEAGEELQPTMAPLFKAIDPVEKIYVAPAGQFRNIPLEVFADGDQFLVERHIFAYLSSGRDLQPKPVTVPKQEVLIVAYPDYGPAAACAWLPLTATRSEATAIAEINNYSNVSLLQGLYARESWLKNLPAPRILHIATHGTFDAACLGGNQAFYQEDQAPEEVLLLAKTGLALMGANQHPTYQSHNLGEDGILTALEISALDLQGTELVCLAVCNSGRENRLPGVAFYSLRRAFQQAGAAAVVSSMWPVPDRQTRRLMRVFYRHQQTEDPATALNSAMRGRLTALRSRGIQPSPRDWGGFTYFGRFNR